MQKGMDPEVNIYKMVWIENFLLAYSYAGNQPQNQTKVKGSGCEEAVFLHNWKTQNKRQTSNLKSMYK